MSKDPAFLFYSSDFIAGTFTMSNAEVGAYIRLLCVQHGKGIISDKDMKNICGDIDRTQVEDKFVKVDGGYFNERLEEVVNKRKKYSDSRRQNRLSGNKDICTTHEKHMSNICKSHDVHMGNGNGIVNRNDNENSISDFVDYVNGKYNRGFRQTEKIRKKFNARLKDYTFEELKTVVDQVYSDEYHKETCFKYATPEYMLREEQIEKWLNATAKKSAPGGMEIKEEFTNL